MTLITAERSGLITSAAVASWVFGIGCLVVSLALAVATDFSPMLLALIGAAFVVLSVTIMNVGWTYFAGEVDE